MNIKSFFLVLFFAGTHANLIAQEPPERVLPNISSLQEFNAAINAINSDAEQMYLSETPAGYVGLYSVGKNIFVCFYGRTPSLILEQNHFEKWSLTDSDGSNINLGDISKLSENPNLLVKTTVIDKGGNSLVYPYYYGSRIPLQNVSQKEVRLILSPLKLAFDISVQPLKILKMYDIAEKATLIPR